MTKLAPRILATIALTGLVSSCGSAGIGSGKSSDWAEDACRTFPKEAASKAAGVAVVKAEPSGQLSTDQTVLSHCSYSGADSSTHFGVLLRQAKTDSQTVDDQIAGLKSQPDMTGPSEDVAMPKGKAVWASKLRTLSYVPADGRMIVVTPPGAIVFGPGAVSPAPDALKAAAIRIASAIEG